MLFKAYSLLPAQSALILNYSWAIVLTLMAAVFLHQKLKLYNILAITVSFFSLAYVAFRGDFTSFQFDNPNGIIIAISTSFVWSAFFILNVKDTLESSIRLMLNFFFGFIYTLIYMILFSNFSSINLSAILGSAYIGLFEMGITFLLWLNALKLSRNTSIISNIIFVSPIISLILISLILKEPIYSSSIIGLSLIIISIVVQNIIDYKRK